MKCVHDLPQWRCIPCCLTDLRARIGQLQDAVSTARAGTGSGGDFVKGGRPSWEPINLSAMSLLQDIAAAGGLRTVEQTLYRTPDPDLERKVRQWRSRALLILGQALKPYPLLWEVRTITVRRNRWHLHFPPVLCPVINENGPCGHPLLVHYDDEPGSATYAQPRTIRCSYTEQHEWNGGRQWLRLGQLFL